MTILNKMLLATAHKGLNQARDRSRLWKKLWH